MVVQSATEEFTATPGTLRFLAGHKRCSRPSVPHADVQHSHVIGRSHSEFGSAAARRPLATKTRRLRNFSTF
ncbi:hypothetical protein BD310DRAFT_937071 [Dichomitus squalens]|uniref:Uncharacterized protein n=1 Tax=Dichomitus squalens TaxID=114155 RepID=A0A4Q9PI95_9APHY|nr:hypothetical protein BD310DRAFT_937071 [Dichomitus squalens]